VEIIFGREEKSKNCCRFLFCHKFIYFLSFDLFLTSGFVPGVVPERAGQVAADDAKAGGQIGGQVLRVGEHERPGPVPPRPRLHGVEHPVDGPSQPPLHPAARQPLVAGLLVRAPPKIGKVFILVTTIVIASEKIRRKIVDSCLVLVLLL
jgi:hypothetical protein